MIRYALIIIIATVVLGLTGAALDGASTVRGAQAIEGEISTVESVAMSLYDLDGSASGVGTARRVVEIDVPEGTRTKDGISFLRFERIRDSDATRVIYRADGGKNRTRVIEVPLQRPGGGPVDLFRSGTHRLVFEPERDADGDPVVVISEYGEKRDLNPTV